MTRKDILDAALKCVNGDRDTQYGNPEDSFKMIANFWNAYLETDIIEPYDVAAMLALLKIARISGGQAKDDNWIDLAGYAACGGEIQNNDETIQTNSGLYSDEYFKKLYTQTCGAVTIHN